MTLRIRVSIPETPTGASKGRGIANSGEQGVWGIVEDPTTGIGRVRDTAPSGKLGELLTKLRSIDPEVDFQVESTRDRIGVILLPSRTGLDQPEKDSILAVLQEFKLRYIPPPPRQPKPATIQGNGEKKTQEGTP